MLGTIVNMTAIIAGAVVGVFLRKGIPERYKTVIMQGIGLSVALIGFRMALKTNNELIVIISLVIGGLIGEALDIEKLLERLGNSVKKLFLSGDGDFVKGFVTSSLVFCVGAMSIMGALESGLTGDHSILYAKSLLDGVSAIIFASTMGWGVVFSGFSVLLYQGILTLLAGAVKVFMTDAVMAEMTATGGLLIMAISSNLLGIKQFKVGNLLPAIFVAVVLAFVFP